MTMNDTCMYDTYSKYRSIYKSKDSVGLHGRIYAEIPVPKHLNTNQSFYLKHAFIFKR